MDNRLSATVQMQFMRPRQLEEALRQFPVVYVPFGLNGIGGLDPREHASTQVGRRNAELAAAAIGRKAQELLASLPEDNRSFGLEAISPEHWWMV